MKKLLLLGVLFSARFYAMACSSCGCSITNQSIGLLSQLPGNFLGMQYELRGFSTTHSGVDDAGGASGMSREYYHTIQLAGRYTILNKVQLLAFVPYVSNQRVRKGGDGMSVAGIGDVTVIANVYAVRKANCTWSHAVLVGGGIKAPTGVYDRQATKTEEGLPNMQPGTHSWDFIANASYTVARNKVGLNADASYALTTANKDDYRFGNRLSTSLSGFYKIKAGGLILLPMLGASFDKNQSDYGAYSKGITETETGGWQLYSAAGVQGFYKRFGMQVRCQLPVAQYHNSGMVTVWHKTDAGVFFML